MKNAEVLFHSKRNNKRESAEVLFYFEKEQQNVKKEQQKESWKRNGKMTRDKGTTK